MIHGLKRAYAAAHDMEKALHKGQIEAVMNCLVVLEKELKLLEAFFPRPGWEDLL